MLKTLSQSNWGIDPMKLGPLRQCSTNVTLAFYPKEQHHKPTQSLASADFGILRICMCACIMCHDSW